jgi:hypothetical protein
MNTITILLMAWSLVISTPKVPADRTLRVGESATITVEAKEAYNNTKLLLVKNGRYEISAKGKWKDASCKETDPDGFLTSECGSSMPGVDILMGATESIRRASAQKWFCLMGEIFDETCNVFDNITADQQFRIGKSRVLTPSVSGKLILFANDVLTAYGNNTGKLTVTIKRTS